MPTDPSGRMLKIDRPLAAPGSCCICGKNEHPNGFVDPQLDFEFFGAAYFCADCGGEMARAFEFIGPSEYADLKQQVDAQMMELTTLRQAVLLLENSVESLSSYRNLSYPSEFTAVSPDDVDAPADTEVPDEPVTDGAVSLVKSDEPVNESGRDDVHDVDAELDAILNI